jgi:hypothetical protein
MVDPEVIEAHPLIDDRFDILASTTQQAVELLHILGQPS